MSKIFNKIITSVGYSSTNTSTHSTSGIIGYTKSQTSNVTSISNSTTRTGSGITLEPGLWSINVQVNVKDVAVQFARIYVSDSANGNFITSNLTNISAYTEFSNNTGNIMKSSLNNVLTNVTTNTNYFPGIYIFLPTANNFNVDFYIWATRLN